MWPTSCPVMKSKPSFATRNCSPRLRGTYEFVYPTVVGPRYSNQPAAAPAPSEQWVAKPLSPSGPETAVYSFRLVTQSFRGAAHSGDDLHVAPGGHPLRQLVPGRCTVWLAANNPAATAILFSSTGLRANSHRIRACCSTKAPQENFFLLMVQPPKRFAPNEIPAARIHLHRGCVGFHAWVSRWRSQSACMRDLLGGLRPTDTFNVLLFCRRIAACWRRNPCRPTRRMSNGRGSHRPPAGRRGHGAAAGARSAHWPLPQPRGSPAPWSLLRMATSRWKRKLSISSEKGSGDANFFSFRHRIECQPVPHRGHGTGRRWGTLCHHQTG